MEVSSPWPEGKASPWYPPLSSRNTPHGGQLFFPVVSSFFISFKSSLGQRPLPSPHCKCIKFWIHYQRENKLETLQVCLDFLNLWLVFKNQEFTIINRGSCLLLKHCMIWALGVSTPSWPPATCLCYLPAWPPKTFEFVTSRSG